MISALCARITPKALLAAALALLLSACQSVLVHEVQSSYSHIQIRDWGSQRTMVFIGESGTAALETVIDRQQPFRLQHSYSHTMMAGLLYTPEVSAGLLIGLGGGAIVRFLNHEMPRMRLDVVEIDPVVVTLAREFFGTVATERTRIFTDDGAGYLRRSRDHYDLILMDAHLMPSAQTNATGLPLTLKAEVFLENLRERLAPNGVAVFNLIEGADTRSNVRLIQQRFAAVDVYRSSSVGNIIIVALAGSRPPMDELRQRAQARDRGADRGFSFERLLDERAPGFTAAE